MKGLCKIVKKYWCKSWRSIRKRLPNFYFFLVVKGCTQKLVHIHKARTHSLADDLVPVIRSEDAQMGGNDVSPVQLSATRQYIVSSR